MRAPHLAFVIVGLASAALGASCALKFTDYPGSGGATAASTSTTTSASTGKSSTTGTSAASSSTGVNPCGNGVLNSTEQCDDGNNLNLDGCDSQCRYEAIARLTEIDLATAMSPSFCFTHTNVFGTHAITQTGFASINALSIFNQLLQDGINKGTTNIMAQVLYLSDLTGNVDATGFSVGVFSGVPDPQKGAWPGTAASNQPIDWWFLVNHTRVDANGLPTGLLPNGTLASRNLMAGPGTASMDLTLNGEPFVATLQHAMVAAIVDDTPAPNAPPTPPPKNGLANGIQVFQTLSGGAGQGICGDLSVESLAYIPIPSELAQGGAYACGACGGASYPPCPNGVASQSCGSLLDVLIGGCVVTGICVTAVKPGQPDVPAGAAITNLSLNASNKVAQNTVGDHDGYSIYLNFKGNRVHATGVK